MKEEEASEPPSWGNRLDLKRATKSGVQDRAMRIIPVREDELNHHMIMWLHHMHQLYFHHCLHQSLIWTHLMFSLITDYVAVDSQRLTVTLWPQLWSPTPPTWHTWTWATTTCRIQQWRLCVLDWRVQTVDWRLWGQFVCCSFCLCSGQMFEVSLVHWLRISTKSCRRERTQCYYYYKKKVRAVIVFVMERSSLLFQT